MTVHLHSIYKPITSAPFRNNDEYHEIPPTPALSPYISCFWGSKGNIKTKQADTAKHGLVVPDTCMDIILDVNFTNNKSESFFCGINDSSFASGGN